MGLKSVVDLTKALEGQDWKSILPGVQLAPENGPNDCCSIQDVLTILKGHLALASTKGELAALQHQKRQELCTKGKDQEVDDAIAKLEDLKSKRDQLKEKIEKINSALVETEAMSTRPSQHVTDVTMKVEASFNECATEVKDTEPSSPSQKEQTKETNQETKETNPQNTSDLPLESASAGANMGGVDNEKEQLFFCYTCKRIYLSAAAKQ